VRSLPAIFVAILVAFIASATALMTNHLGVRDWPAAPAPQISTRVVTPAEQVAVERVTRKRGGEAAAPGENGRQRIDTPGPVRAAAPARRPGAARRAETARPPQTQLADNAPEPTTQTPPPAPAPAAPQPAPPPADPVSQARDDVVVPALPDVAPPALTTPPQPEAGDADHGQHGDGYDGGGHGHNGGGRPGRGHGRGHGLVRNLLGQLP
jgi:hypothetical protein